MFQYAKCHKTIERFLRGGRVGAIGHISCTDRRPQAQARSSTERLHEELAATGAAHLAEICKLVGGTAASIVARSTEKERSASLQIFLQLHEENSIHYFATSESDYCDHQLWIEGTKGSLRTDGKSVWWRKRGWPIFIPVRIGLFGGPSKASSANVPAELATAIRNSAQAREAVDVVTTENTASIE